MTMADTAAPIPESGAPDEQKLSATTLGPSRSSMRRTKRRVKILVGLLALTLIVIVFLLYHHYSAWESTDDAQIDGYIYPISPRVAGYVTGVMVDDDQYVKAGTTLVRLDSKDYDVALANANAALANDRASASAQHTNVPITSVNTSSQLASATADVENAKAGVAGAQRQYDAARASLAQAEANDQKARDDVNRYRPLATSDEIPQQQY